MLFQHQSISYPLASGSSSFFLVLSPGSAFFFMYLINLDSSCSNATNTGLSCLCSKKNIFNEYSMTKDLLTKFNDIKNKRLNLCNFMLISYAAIRVNSSVGGRGVVWGGEDPGDFNIFRGRSGGWFPKKLYMVLHHWGV